MKMYPCELAKSKTCEHGGNKHYNYGFVSGTAAYCRLMQKWVCDIKTRYGKCSKDVNARDLP
jgi:hypothetical protein